jgi:hypothetical protein
MKICEQKIHNIVANFNATKVIVQAKVKQYRHMPWGFQEVDALRI